MAIDPEQVQRLFLAVLELSNSQDRDAFLADRCGDDCELRRRVQALLRAHDETGFDLANSPLDAGVRSEFATNGIRAGTILADRYKLIEEIGEGGMGSVWLADQREPVRRRVAVKLIKPGMDSKQVLARFEAERQALAMMDHPNIAKVYDGGVTDFARPFFVMEYVKGVPLTAYCDQAQLSIQERLRLFLPICQAVQHAHQKGVIHRDLKPTNILICLYDGKPIPKVIDFGLAKAIHQSLTEQSIYTAHGVMVGTPLYMSPEQAEHNNLDVDTRTDVYSLGVILYELLTGSTPLERKQFKDVAIHEILRLIREVEPPKPSHRLSGSAKLPNIAAQRSIAPGDLPRSLSGELDWIVMKTLEKERSRRYETAFSLASDIQRFLSGEAVDACPPSASYRFRVFLRRNLAAILTVSAFVIVLIVGTLVSAWQAIRARQAEANVRIALEKEAELREIAETARSVADAERSNAVTAAANEAQHRATAERLRSQMQHVLDAMTSTITGDALSKQTELSEEQKVFLNQALAYYKALSSEQANDQESQVLAAAAALRVGEIEHRLGRSAEAMLAFAAAVDGYSHLSEVAANGTHYQEMTAKSSNNLGIVLVQVGKLDEGIRRYQNAQHILESLVQENPNGVTHQLALVGTYSNLAIAWIRLQQSDKATEQLLKGVRILELLLVTDPNSAELQFEFARVEGNLGLALNAAGQNSQALAKFRLSLAVQESLVERFPKVRRYRQDLAINHTNVGLMVSVMESKDDAIPHYLRAIGLREKLAVEFPLVPEYRRELAKSHGALAELLAGMGKLVDSLQHNRQSILILEHLVQLYPALPVYRQELARNQTSLGILMNAMAKPIEANNEFVKARLGLEHLAAQFPDQIEYRQEVGTSHNNSAAILTEVGRRQEALKHHRTALKIRQTLFVEHPTTVSLLHDLTFSQNNLAALLIDLRQFEEARVLLESANENCEKLAREQPQVIGFRILQAMIHYNLGDLCLSEGRFEESITWLEKGSELGANVPNSSRDTTAEQLIRSCHRGLNKARLFNHATIEIDPQLKVPSQNSTWGGRDCYDLACVYSIAAETSESQSADRTTQALEFLGKALQSGWNDLEMLESDPELDAIRSSTAFGAMVRQLEEKAMKDNDVDTNRHDSDLGT